MTTFTFVSLGFGFIWGTMVMGWSVDGRCEVVTVRKYSGKEEME